ncbi:MAG: hypothetical protein ORN98_07400 [Alphaproteobacteria bacterium]|nr:hypothetical protein [Alphaproteobacteria bacterium]
MPTSIARYRFFSEHPMQNTANFSFPIDSQLKSAFLSAVHAEGGDEDQILREFIREFVQSKMSNQSHDVWFRRQAQIGLQEANSGKIISGEQIEAEFSRRRAELQQKIDPR